MIHHYPSKTLPKFYGINSRTKNPNTTRYKRRDNLSLSKVLKATPTPKKQPSSKRNHSNHSRVGRQPSKVSLRSEADSKPKIGTSRQSRARETPSAEKNPVLTTLEPRSKSSHSKAEKLARRKQILRASSSRLNDPSQGSKTNRDHLLNAPMRGTKVKIRSSNSPDSEINKSLRNLHTEKPKRKGRENSSKSKLLNCKSRKKKKPNYKDKEDQFVPTEQSDIEERVQKINCSTRHIRDSPESHRDIPSPKFLSPLPVQSKIKQRIVQKPKGNQRLDRDLLKSSKTLKKGGKVKVSSKGEKNGAKNRLDRIVKRTHRDYRGEINANQKAKNLTRKRRRKLEDKIYLKRGKVAPKYKNRTFYLKKKVEDLKEKRSARNKTSVTSRSGFNRSRDGESQKMSKLDKKFLRSFQKNKSKGTRTARDHAPQQSLGAIQLERRKHFSTVGVMNTGKGAGVARRPYGKVGGDDQSEEIQKYKRLCFEQELELQSLRKQLSECNEKLILSRQKTQVRPFLSTLKYRKQSFKTAEFS